MRKESRDKFPAKKVMKKFLCCLLVGVMMLGVASCEKKEEVAMDDTPVLTCYIPGDPQADIDMINKKASEILKEKIGAGIDIKFIDTGSYQERMKMNFASKAECDVVWTGYLLSYIMQGKSGGLMDMRPLLETVTPEFYASLSKEMINVGSDGDIIYAIPNEQIFGMSRCFMLRKDLVEKYNFDVSSVDELSDLEPFLQQVKDNEPELIPVKGFCPTDAPYKFAEDQRYEKVFGEILFYDYQTGRVIPYYEMENAKENAQFHHEWYKKGFIRSDIATVMDDSGDYANGRYAAENTVYKPGVEVEVKIATGYDYIPVKVTNPLITTGNMNATALSIAATSKHPEKAMQLIEQLNTNKELFNLVSFGVEGVHYNKIAENRIELIENSGYNPNASWKFGKVYNAYLTDDMADDCWEQTDKINKEAKASPLLGFIRNTDGLTTEIAQIQTVNDKYLVSMINRGCDDPETYWEQYIAEMEQAGIRKVQEALQKQIDEFLQSKH